MPEGARRFQPRPDSGPHPAERQVPVMPRQRTMNIIIFPTLIVRGAVILLIFIFIANLTIYLATQPYIHESAEDIPPAQTVLIPGAAVLGDGSLSSIFSDRVN